MKKFPRLVIAGIRGGTGKTLLSLSIVASARFKKGLKVIPFKKGPDYIDSGWLARVAENPCYNLDSFFIPEDKIKYSFFKHFKGDIAIIEGNRGLFDGIDASGSYSTAELSKLLKAPVILVIDCSKTTATVAAMVLGCINMDREVKIGGVVLNQVSGKRHEAVIRDAIVRHCHIPVLGAIPRLETELPERHMGLLPYQEHHDAEKIISIVREIGERYIDINGLITVAENTELLRDDLDLSGQDKNATRTVKIGVVRDSAFQFYYPENLEELERQGAELLEISALSENQMPDIDAMYIGGGFPETHAIALAENKTFLNSLGRSINRGLPVYAECGGLMYLGKGLYLNERFYEMVNIFPITFTIEKRPQAHGYTIAEVVRKNPFYPSGVTIKGHEFHYSRPILTENKSRGLDYAFSMRRGTGIAEKKDGLFYQNVFATYTHVHAYGVPEWTEGMIMAAKRFQEIKEEKR
ncbi:MAG: cobyrinate a,c-diamide synthase [Thermodesulfovibrionales bacterium]